MPRDQMKLVHTLDEIIVVHNEFRDHIADLCHGEHETRFDPLFTIVLLKTFNFCFNTYKAIGLLLPDRHYENGGALLRVMWEATLNLAWVAAGPLERSRAFLQFTVVETHRFRQGRVRELEALGDSEHAAQTRQDLTEFEKAYGEILEEFRNAGRGGKRLAQRFSSSNLESLAVEIGENWLAEYRGIYPLLCAFAHGSPGVVLFPLPVVKDFRELDIDAIARTEEPRTVDLALWSMSVMERSYSALLQATGTADDAYLDELDRRTSFRSSMSRTTA